MEFALPAVSDWAKRVNTLSTSALPDAPVVPEGQRAGIRLGALRARVATALHRLAWALEPGVTR
jgi:hypothetical protein